MAKINGKDMEVWLKRGMGTQEIANELGISDSELIELIEKSFTRNGVKAFKRRLAKNDKMLSKKDNTTMENEQISETTIEVETQDETTETRELSIPELRDEEENQQKKTVAQEIVVKETIQLYRKVLEEVTSKSKQVSNLIAQLTILRTEISQLEENAIIALENHDNELGKLHEEQEKLKKLREEIEKRSIVNVFIYANGNISLDSDGVSIETDFEGWKDKKELLEEEYEDIVSDLSLRYIKQLAKLMWLPPLSEGTRYVFSFELAEIEEVYHKLMHKKGEE